MNKVPQWPGTGIFLSAAAFLYSTVVLFRSIRLRSRIMDRDEKIIKQNNLITFYVTRNTELHKQIGDLRKDNATLKAHIDQLQGLLPGSGGVNEL